MNGFGESDEIQQDLDCWRLRVQGLTYAEIAAEKGYAGPSGAYAAVRRAQERAITESSEELRLLEAQRLDYLEQQLWPTLEEADSVRDRLQAVGGILKVMERRAKLWGLDAPTKAQEEVAYYDGTSPEAQEMHEAMTQLHEITLARKRSGLDVSHEAIMDTIHQIEEELRSQ